MIFYIVCGIIMTMNKIEFLKDDQGNQQVLQFLNTLSERTQTDANSFQLLHLVARGFEALTIYGITQAVKRYITLEREDGKPYTISLVKPLKFHRPLLEFRINWEGIGALRIIFFEYCHLNITIYVMLKAVLKETTSDPDFEVAASECEILYHAFLANPEKYINLKE